MTAFPEIELELANVKATISPKRGGIVTGLEVDGTQLLFMDRTTFEDPSKSVRGGIPLLFPFAGKIENDQLNITRTNIPQHGFARNKEWKATKQGKSGLLLELEPDAQIREIYPWLFRLEYNLMLTERGLHMELMVDNMGQHPMPIALGWHPYFQCAADKKEQVRGDTPALPSGFIHDHSDVNFGIIPPPQSHPTFSIPDLGQIKITFAPLMRYLQIWSIPGRDFICLEPFIGAPNLINTAQSHMVPPNEARTYWMRIEKVG
jgi:galactose mutarotase-like enzyme